MNKERIDQYIDEHFDELLETLRSLVQIPSCYSEPKEGMPYGEDVAKVLDKTLSICKDFGFETRNLDNYVGIVTYGKEPAELGILPHLDIVPVGDGWTVPPYEGVIKDGRMYGRGTIDDKGPAVASIYALRAIKELGIPLKKGVRIIFGTDEERATDSELKYYMEHETMPPKVFTPDCNFPVINVEKGTVRYSFVRDFSKEEHNRAILEIHGGKTPNAIPAKASAVVKGFSIEELKTVAEKEVPTISFSFENHPNGIEIVAEGTAAHAAFLETGNNALTGLLKMLLSLPLDDCEALRCIRYIYQLFPYGDYSGKALGIAASDGDRSGDLTLAFTQMEYDEESLFGHVDVRFPVICDGQEILDVLNKAVQKVGFTMKDDLILDSPHIVPEESEFIQSLISVYREYTGDATATCEYTGGGTYVHNIDGGVTFGAIFPDHPDTCFHNADEFVILDDLKDATKMFARAILEICG